MAKILIVEDEKTIADIVAFNLGRENYTVEIAYDGLEGFEKAKSADVDLILLDVMLPGMDGFEICRRVREQSQVPIIMLTAREEEADKVFGLEIGADDYITKPFSMRELTARVRANLRRQAPPEPKSSPADLHVGGLEVFLDAHLVKKDGKSLELTAREFEIIRFMCENAGRVVSR
ncbi:MAG: response regulator transcription factor, partial [Oscillospiraceae bacterium]|nr:response regulator transcription factor [Oscillospiraceae bacterium]